MRSVHAALIILAPWLAGTLAIRMRWPELEAGRWPIAIGYGYFLGTAVAAALLWVQGTLSGSIDPLPVTGTFLVLCFALGWLSPIRIARPLGLPNLFAVLLLAILAFRIGSLALEMGQNGLMHGWDAASTWMYRARVWVETEELVGFVGSTQWLAAPESSSFALAASQYPPLVSLIAALPSLAFGEWHEIWSSMPWLLAYIALGVALYGQCRVWRTPTPVALFLVWLVWSLPLLGSQVAVAGYADLWMAACLSLAFVSFLAWTRDRNRSQGLIALLMISMTAFVKMEGVIWALLFIPALIAARWSVKGLLIFAGTICALLAMVAFLGPFEGEVPVLGRFAISTVSFSTDLTGTVELVRQEGVWRPLLVHLFVFGSMHLLGLAVLIALAVQLIPAALGEARGMDAAWQRAGLTWIVTMCLALYTLFFWTSAGEWVRQGTSVNRLIMQMTPAFVFWCQLVLLDNLSNARSTPCIDDERKAAEKG